MPLPHHDVHNNSLSIPVYVARLNVIINYTNLIEHNKTKY